MTDRDRLIELFQEMDKDFGITCPNINTNKSCKGCKYQISGAFIDCDYLARKVDYLLANGVIVPQVKIGQTVYVPSGDEEMDWIDKYKVKYFYCSSKGINRYFIECGTMGNSFRPKDIGKTVFLTKEEAEAELRKRSGDNGNL